MRSVARPQQADRVPGEYIVTITAGADNPTEALRNAYSEFGIIRLTPIGSDRYVLKLERDPGPAAIEQKARDLPAVKSVQPNLIYRAQ